MYTPVLLYKKWGLRGSEIYRHVFVMFTVEASHGQAFSALRFGSQSPGCPTEEECYIYDCTGFIAEILSLSFHHRLDMT